MYIYIYMCVCIHVCVCSGEPGSGRRGLTRPLYHSRIPTRTPPSPTVAGIFMCVYR